MLIKDSQINALGIPAKERFILQTIRFLRENTSDWAVDKNDEEIRRDIENMIRIGDEKNIKKEINIQKMLYHWIKYDLSLPFNEQIDHSLSIEGLNENRRIKEMIKVIRKHHG
ncbi:MAG: hypothetical protein HKN45_07265 [Flavobacteriales bacterium]|nr:hypothetical protein [Flavobacteriales bacterium]